MPNPKSRKVLMLINKDWGASVEVRREQNGTYTVDVYSMGTLVKTHTHNKIRAALVQACDIVGEA